MSSAGGIYGLSGSGMDVDALVKSLMTGQKTKEDTLIQQRTVLEWQKTAYNKVYDDISKFRDSLFNYKLESTLSPHSVSSSNTSVVTATANADAVDVNHSLVVAQVASGVNLLSSATISSGDKTTLATQMGVQNSFTLNIANGTTSKSITVNPTDSINDVVSAINNAGIKVKASYDSTLDRFFLSTTDLGSSTGINITTTSDSTTGRDDGGLFVEGLHLYSSAGTTNDDGTNITTTFTSESGKDAVIQLDGVQLTQDSNTFTIAGVTYNLIGVSSGASVDSGGTPTWGSGNTTNVSVSFDVDKAVSTIQSLVDSYNDILSELNDMVDEERYTDYPPLTDDQKSAMQDSDIEAWEKKAKSGMLHNDSTVTSLINSMRNLFIGSVSGISQTYDSKTGKMVTYNSAASIGITTGDYTEEGKLYLNTDDLKAALNNNPDVLKQLFGATGTTTVNGKKTTDTRAQGIAGRLYDTIKTSMDQLQRIAGTTASTSYDTQSDFAKRIAAKNDELDIAYDRYDVMEAAYYAKFNAMEEALAQLNNQSSWLTSQLSSS
ncbi:flagellar capping protein [Desulfosporosinus orientis DSM 765]|uniref:Flagellar hook-associated protein 2 n=1 Tax=Desulfosporosinus orientis (strain ATCC 19365 / DSM 765 / NCIMB 8382 / VKM B-1628 / Singapore I) TaxID=768706 RepID=G7WI03_DESOD|nr:flagellar filament capping protein FliD [Desulfosporosinus orientis]AET70300.1 flagellar capping protein [Desulfosporosinus orientis DSM 765]